VPRKHISPVRPDLEDTTPLLVTTQSKRIRDANREGQLGIRINLRDIVSASDRRSCREAFPYLQKARGSEAQKDMLTTDEIALIQIALDVAILPIPVVDGRCCGWIVVSHDATPS